MLGKSEMLSPHYQDGFTQAIPPSLPSQKTPKILKGLNCTVGVGSNHNQIEHNFLYQIRH